MKVKQLLGNLAALLLRLACGDNRIEKGPIKRLEQVDGVSLDDDWRFIRYGLQAEGTRVDELAGMFELATNDSDWKTLDVLLDFAIKGPFRMDLVENTGRLPFQGIGWYRKTFTVAEADQGKCFYVDFDGVMANAQVWLNGEYAGTWPYGYNSFR